MFRKGYLPEFHPQAKAPYLSFVFLLAFLGLRLVLVRGQNYKLVLDSEFSPPAVIPTDPKYLVYSVPINQQTSQPTLAYIKDKAGKTVSSFNKTIKVYVTSMDKSQKGPADVDKWRDSGGKLCQWIDTDIDWPMRLTRDDYSIKCGSSLRTTTLITKVFNGKIIVDWIMHRHTSNELPANERFIRIEIPDLKLSTDTNLFKITKGAARINITAQPNISVEANNNINVSAEIQDEKGVVLTEGLDSVAYVDLTVAYDKKLFHHIDGKDMLLKSTTVRLGGPSVSMYQATRDLVSRQRAVAGKVSFNNIRILDACYKLVLNLTMYMSKDPFLRIPNCEKCYSDLGFKTITNEHFVQFHIPPTNILNDIPSMAFTDPFDVVEQKMAKLKYINKYKGTGKMKITRNFPIPGPIVIEIQDHLGNRIFTGADSDLPLSVETLPKGVCFSSDYEVISYEGLATFTGSICQNIDSLFLIFYSKKMTGINVITQEIQVQGNVHIAHFDHFEFTGAGREISPHINSFIRFATRDVNEGIIPGVLRPFNMKLIVDTIETKNDVSNTISQYKYITDLSEDDPSSEIRAAILSGSSHVRRAITQELFHHKIPQISLDAKESAHIGYTYFNRVCWNSRQIYFSFFKFCIERHWLKMVVLKTANIRVSRAFYRYGRVLQMELHEIIIDHVNVQWKAKHPDNKNVLKQAMLDVKKKEIKVITCFASDTQIPAILRIAKKEGLSSEEGYQWLFVGRFAWGFPFNNSLSCDIYPECTTVFGGTLLFTELYNTTYMHSEEWERLLNYLYSADRSSYYGLTPTYPNGDKAARLALGYDAIWLYARALTNIASRRQTATTQRVIDEIRSVTIDGLSGIIKLDKNGDREGFQANVRIINATRILQPMEEVAPLYKYIKMMPDDSNIEYVYEDDKNTPFTAETILEPRAPLSKLYNIYKSESKSGRISKTDLQLRKYSNETWPSRSIIRKEKTIPSFTCSRPCGNITSEENINEYDRGKCIAMDTCKCNKGYFERYCQGIVCKCSHGYCKEPYKCICDKGYTGVTCGDAICPDGCVNGVCVGPNKCKCWQSSWVGPSCQIHLAAILLPLIIFLILFIYLGYKFFFFLRRRIERATALLNLDWLVDWQEVIQLDSYSATSGTSMCGFGKNVYSWRKRKYFKKKLYSNTVDQNDVDVHLEMVELITINHQNLIAYGGACLVQPDVSFFVEVCRKGSLDDVLLNETINLGWNFRVSFMKDICRGMNYLHTKTKIASHGRLKSSNCLLDNRWCIKITDFGAPTIRYGPYLTEKNDEEKSMEYYSMQESMLWTAPELLESAACLDDVKMGTKEGDIYSFAIVISEIATRDLPFAYERGFLSTCALLDLVINQEDPEVEEERRIWESLNNGMSIVRPYIRSEDLPENAETQSKFRKMLDDMWGNDPIARPTFPKLKNVLDQIFPTKEGLMDNLMHLLESYSKDLERIVIERTAALEEEKTKVETIVSQMLPKMVMHELKMGNKLEPENFQCVTVYYSDIVGFTSIAKSIEPMQVIDLLHELYSLFDSILSRYDVYKLDTIGDAYVVSSGVPTLNGDLHAGEIASASLDLMSSIMTMEPHEETGKLQLRLGISTGPVVAGVVGIRMPRYTLFGDTMLIASLMESSSKPMHIQMSEYTVNILSRLGTYTMKYRKKMKACGRNIDTYWLTGKTGFDHQLPIIEEDVE